MVLGDTRGYAHAARMRIDRSARVATHARLAARTRPTLPRWGRWAPSWHATPRGCRAGVALSTSAALRQPHEGDPERAAQRAREGGERAQPRGPRTARRALRERARRPRSRPWARSTSDAGCGTSPTRRSCASSGCTRRPSGICSSSRPSGARRPRRRDASHVMAPEGWVAGSWVDGDRTRQARAFAQIDNGSPSGRKLLRRRRSLAEANKPRAPRALGADEHGYFVGDAPAAPPRAADALALTRPSRAPLLADGRISEGRLGGRVGGRRNRRACRGGAPPQRTAMTRCSAMACGARPRTRRRSMSSAASARARCSMNRARTRPVATAAARAARAPLDRRDRGRARRDGDRGRRRSGRARARGRGTRTPSVR